MKEPMELSVEESLARLSGEVIGRLAIVTPRGPRIVPVNYAVLGDAIVFRTTPYSEVARFGIGKEAAFEVDHLDHDELSGWSVVAVGTIEEVDPADLADERDLPGPHPWAGGVRNLYLGVRWRELTGRRLQNGFTTSEPSPR